VSSRDQVFRRNRWIQSLPGTYPRLKVVDCSYAYCDPTSATSAPRTNYSYDGLHPKAQGMFAVAQQVANWINVLYPAPGIATPSKVDAFSVDNPNGNLLTNALYLTATGGTVSGQATGTAAASWTCGSAAASTFVATVSVPTGSDGQNRQQFVLGTSGTWASTSLFSFTQSPTVGNFAAGDVIDAMLEFEVDAGLANVAGISLVQRATMGGTLMTYESGYAGAIPGDDFPATAFSGVLRAPLMPITAVPTTCDFQARIYIKGAGTSTPAGTIRFGAASMRKVDA
jgi:hypothetical protein